jgi:hypothetical protein
LAFGGLVKGKLGGGMISDGQGRNNRLEDCAPEIEVPISVNAGLHMLNKHVGDISKMHNPGFSHFSMIAA